MQCCVEEAIEILERTPHTLESLLSGLSAGWLESNEGEGTWSAEEVVGHLLVAEHTNWIPRLLVMLREGGDRSFPPFDRYAHLDGKVNTPTGQLLQQFKSIRADNMAKLRTLLVSDSLLERTGEHPEFGTVKVRELLATWVVHDLTHMAQIVRIMAARYKQDVGPWRSYLGILNRD